MIAASLRFPVLVGVYLLVDTGTQIAFEATSRAIGDMPISPAFLQAVAQSPASWVAALLYFATYASWILILKYCSLGRAFPLTTLSYVTVPLASWLIFDEGVGLVPAAGIALILAGVWLIGPQAEQQADQVDPAAPETAASSTGAK
ncbi:EamA family transporter [Ancylobacter defluvii]|uniref:EamA domain-containing protein n=1 Tax=Ancylobacter defluvii TaxID=1282440 RepID=A0A9W6JXQ0_9HYPH|nr:EamA family transporter [Ancylobacter defluvii]MBS7586513.1 EamA family transporter [Ancylobacter defluvii]GLK85800.1 hypothetical protein GCM10017653_38700 [Ancylobacter defluvii]